MSDQDELTPADRELESALQSLAPAAARIDPVSAAFEAGRRSSRRQVRLWQFVAAAMLLVSATAFLMPGEHGLGSTGSPRQATPIADSGRANPTFSAQSFAMLQAAVREHGVDGLPAVDLPAASPTRFEYRL